MVTVIDNRPKPRGAATRGYMNRSQNEHDTPYYWKSTDGKFVWNNDGNEDKLDFSGSVVEPPVKKRGRGRPKKYKKVTPDEKTASPFNKIAPVCASPGSERGATVVTTPFVGESNNKVLQSLLPHSGEKEEQSCTETTVASDLKLAPTLHSTSKRLAYETGTKELREASSQQQQIDFLLQQIHEKDQEISELRRIQSSNGTTLSPPSRIIAPRSIARAFIPKITENRSDQIGGQEKDHLFLLRSSASLETSNRKQPGSSPSSMVEEVEYAPPMLTPTKDIFSVESTNHTSKLKLPNSQTVALDKKGAAMENASETKTRDVSQDTNEIPVSGSSAATDQSCKDMNESCEPKSDLVNDKRRQQFEQWVTQIESLQNVHHSEIEALKDVHADALRNQINSRLQMQGELSRQNSEKLHSISHSHLPEITKQNQEIDMLRRDAKRNNEKHTAEMNALKKEHQEKLIQFRRSEDLLVAEIAALKNSQAELKCKTHILKVEYEKEIKQQTEQKTKITEQNQYLIKEIKNRSEKHQEEISALKKNFEDELKSLVKTKKVELQSDAEHMARIDSMLKLRKDVYKNKNEHRRTQIKALEKYVSQHEELKYKADQFEDELIRQAEHNQVQISALNKQHHKELLQNETAKNCSPLRRNQKKELLEVRSSLEEQLLSSLQKELLATEKMKAAENREKGLLKEIEKRDTRINSLNQLNKELKDSTMQQIQTLKDSHEEELRKEIEASNEKLREVLEREMVKKIKEEEKKHRLQISEREAQIQTIMRSIGELEQNVATSRFQTQSPDDSLTEEIEINDNQLHSIHNDIVEIKEHYEQQLRDRDIQIESMEERCRHMLSSCTCDFVPGSANVDKIVNNVSESPTLNKKLRIFEKEMKARVANIKHEHQKALTNKDSQIRILKTRCESLRQAHKAHVEKLTRQLELKLSEAQKRLEGAEKSKSETIKNLNQKHKKEMREIVKNHGVELTRLNDLHENKEYDMGKELERATREKEAAIMQNLSLQKLQIESELKIQSLRQRLANTQVQITGQNGAPGQQREDAEDEEDIRYRELLEQVVRESRAKIPHLERRIERRNKTIQKLERYICQASASGESSFTDAVNESLHSHAVVLPNNSEKKITAVGKVTQNVVADGDENIQAEIPERDDAPKSNWNEDGSCNSPSRKRKLPELAPSPQCTGRINTPRSRIAGSFNNKKQVARLDDVADSRCDVDSPELTCGSSELTNKQRRKRHRKHKSRLIIADPFNDEPETDCI